MPPSLKLNETPPEFVVEQTALDQAAIGVAYVNPVGRLLRVNKKFCDIVGYSQAELLSKDFQDITHPDDLPRNLNHYRAALTGDTQTFSMEKRYLRKDGAVIWVEVTSSLVRDPAGEARYFIAFVVDVTRRKQAEQRVRHLTRLYAMLSQVNQSIVRVKERNQFFHDMCRIAVQFGAFRLAWIGWTDRQANRVRPVAFWGYEAGYLNQIRITLGDEPTGHGPVGSATRTGTTCVCNDIEHDPAMAPWRKEALKRGYRSAASIPLWLHGQVVGSFNLYAAESEFFTYEEVKLLKEVGSDISFALATLEKEEQHRRAKKAAEQVSAFRATMIQTAAEGICVYHPITAHPFIMVTVWNQRMEEITGYTLAEINQTGWYQGLYPDPALQERAKARILRMRSGDHLYSEPWLITRKDGGQRDVEISTSTVEGDDGVPSVVAFIHDVTARTHYEQALRGQLDLEKLIVAISSQFIHTPAESLDGAIQQALQSLGEFIGMDRSYVFQFAADGLTVSNTHEWCAPGIEPQIGLLRSLPISVVPWSIEKIRRLELLHVPTLGDLPGEAAVDKALFQELGLRAFICIPLAQTGRVIGFMGFDVVRGDKRLREQDIIPLRMSSQLFADALERQRAEREIRLLNETLEQRVEERTAALLQENAERQRAEAALRERGEELSMTNAELIKANRAKDEFLATMSHELRTPLNGVLGMAELLRLQSYGPLSEKQDKALGTIQECGHHLLSLINDILDVAKIEAGKVVLQTEPVALEDLCQASLRLVKQMAHAKRQSIEQRVEPDALAVRADRRRLKQMLVNLLSNAVKFTPDEGALGVEVVGDSAARVVRLTVWDHGVGIRPEDLARLFQPFIQLDSSLSRQHAGTGLGLWLTRRLAELHGGTLNVTSEFGRGSRFTITLPWAGEMVAGQTGAPLATAPLVFAPAPDSDGASPPPLLLLAEDDEINLSILASFLEIQGYRLVVARNGEEAVTLARENQPDLILMDIQMPGMDGLEATRRLRAETRTARTPVIALTGLAMPGDRERCLAAGADEYLTKPVDLDALAWVIHDQLKSER